MFEKKIDRYFRGIKRRTWLLMRAVRQRNGARRMPSADMAPIVVTTITTDFIAAIMGTDAAFHRPDVVTSEPGDTALWPDSDSYEGFCITMGPTNLTFYFCFKLQLFQCGSNKLHCNIILIDDAFRIFVIPISLYRS